MSEKNEVRFNLCVVRQVEAHRVSGLHHWCEPCETLSREDAHKQWEVGSTDGDKVVAVTEVVLSNEDMRPYAETYKALDALNALSDEPRVQDLLTRIFTLGFEAGLKCKQEELREVLGV